MMRPASIRRRLLAAAVFLAGAAGPAPAQVPDGPAELPRALADELIAFYNRPETIHLSGDSRLPAGGELVGDVAVLGGSFTLGGRVRGRLVVINGHLRLLAGAEIAGPLTVVGGTATGLEGARVAGPVTTHPAALRYRHVDGRLAYQAPPGSRAITAGRAFGFGRTDLTLAVRDAYNRVEGLPVAAGPRLELGRSNPTRLEALAIYRSESGLKLDTDELGYVLRAEQFLGGHRAARVGAVLRSEILPIEDRGVSDRESSLATFFLHRDLRDHYRREGWGAYVRYLPAGGPYELALEYRDDEHGIVSARGPWALVDNDQEWRPQPVVAAGTLRSVALRLGYDTRNSSAEPSTGSAVRLELEQGLGGSLHQVVVFDPETGEPRPGRAAAPRTFTAGFLDARRYARLGPGSVLALRAVAAGSIDGGTLPPQRQTALGGEGSLPGYAPFAFDCGARRDTVTILSSAFIPYYGCDRALLVQAEYSVRLPFQLGLGERLGWDVEPGGSPALVLFFDAGRAWAEAGGPAGRRRSTDDFAADAGLGLRLGPIGLYWAVPLTGDDRGPNFFVRLGPRL